MSTALTSMPAARTPSVRVAEVRAMVGLLVTTGDWLTAKEISVTIGEPTPAWERRVRAAASVAAPVVVSYPGSPGYKHFSLCTDEEIIHCINAIEAQSRDMGRRAKLYRRALDRRQSETLATEVQADLPLELA